MRLIGYLINTADMGPTYGGRLKVPLGLREMPERFAENGGLYGVTDSSFGKNVRPHGGYAVLFMNAAVLWSSKAFKLMIPGSRERGSRGPKMKCSYASFFAGGVYLR